MSHTAGELELELTIGKFRMVAMADSAFVADQWAQAITSITLTLTPNPTLTLTPRPTPNPNPHPSPYP